MTAEATMVYKCEHEHGGARTVPCMHGCNDAPKCEHCEAPMVSAKNGAYRGLFSCPNFCFQFGDPRGKCACKSCVELREEKAAIVAKTGAGIDLMTALKDSLQGDPIHALAILTSNLHQHLPIAKATQLREAYELVLRERERHQTEITQLRADLEASDDDFDTKALDEIQQLRADCLTLAKLAAGTPQFFNPLVAMEAIELRDRVLAEEAR